ncbi:carbon monoxide dehydrogenase subunit G [Haloactinopolyspora alba]|uniref:Carbon monoxide dehydrogenase subunit G n=1 Tax=Haloactinopolyspora alba TaxID=648780 RepID=A0A2P8DR75_9ACTN|nr:SRPBCC family protein [Haloactinopolyspora alba]PSK99716.1 carbon monoxide dehydrogenase subunit G [Haloactinopolyspora alba]
MPARSYEFATVWRIAAPVDTTWAFLTAPEQRWHDWWPYLESIGVDRTGELYGSVARCVWRSPIGYRLRLTLELVDVDVGRQVSLAVTGDLDGTGVIGFAPDHCGSRLDVRWSVRTRRGWMNAAGPLLRPLFRYGHDVVMSHGERGLNRALGSPDSADRAPRKPRRPRDVPAPWSRRSR